MKVTMVEHRINAIVNRLEKTKVREPALRSCMTCAPLETQRRTPRTEQEKAERKQAAIDKGAARRGRVARLT